MSIVLRIVVSLALASALTPAFAAEPLFTLSEDGSAFIYKARPGDQPGSVAAMFGIAPSDVPAFLAANGITDPTRVSVGHVYRVPNPVTLRNAASEAKAQQLERDVAELRARADQLTRDLESSRASAAAAERRVAQLARFERLWPLVTIVGTLLVLAAAIAGWFAFAALRKTDVAERHARTLANELEEKRRTALAERQQSAKRILDLETKVRDLEIQVAAPAAPRRSPAGGTG